MKKINLKSGTLFLKSVSTEKEPFCRFIAKASKRFGTVTEVSMKGVFLHYRYQFLGFVVCLEPAHIRYESRFDIDPETLEITNYKQLPVSVADQWFVYGR